MQETRKTVFDCDYVYSGEVDGVKRLNQVWLQHWDLLGVPIQLSGKWTFIKIIFIGCASALYKDLLYTTIYGL